MVEQTPWRRANNIHTTGCFFALLPITDPSVHQGNCQIREASVITKSRFDLRRELAGRFQNETSESAVRREIGQNRQRERGRLPGSGLRGADQVLARKDHGECAELDRRRLRKPHRLRPFDDLRGEAKIFKRHLPKVLQKEPFARERKMLQV